MGFFTDFIGAFTGANEREAGRERARGFLKGIEFTNDEIAKARNLTSQQVGRAFENVEAGLEATLPIPAEVLRAQLQLLGAGTESLAPEGATNALRRAVRQGNAQLLGTGNRSSQAFQRPVEETVTEISATPLTTPNPRFKSPLLGS